jgi:hypothetical protein
MAKPNYQFEKRKRELEKKNKKAEKANRKTPGDAAEPVSESTTPPEPASPAGEA